MREEIRVGDEVLFLVPKQSKLDGVWDGPALVTAQVGSRLFMIAVDGREAGPMVDYGRRIMHDAMQLSLKVGSSGD